MNDNLIDLIRFRSDIFGYPDDLKLLSSMTLFANVANPDSIFVRVLEKYFHGEQDLKTLRILGHLKETPTSGSA
jgi:uncharacterized protein (DUF1810 family)